MDYQNLLVSEANGVLTLTLNRPERLNAFTRDLLDELLAAFEAARSATSVRAVVLTGAGRGFCAGADLVAGSEAMMQEAAFSYSAMLKRHYNPLILLMRSLPKPILAAVNGVAAGAGMSLALACDLRLAAESASFTQAFVKVGLVPDSGSTWFLPKLVGPARALELMMTGRRVTADEALALGLANRVTPDSNLLAVTQEMAEGLASGPTVALGLIKAAYEFGVESSLAAALDYEADAQDVAGASTDHAEGVTAFLSKRSPSFRGA